MSKIFIISNTNFNFSKNITSKDWLKNLNDYYYNIFIPYLNSNVDDNDILIHLGNFISKSKIIDLNILKFIQELFENLSKILPVFILEGENDELPLNMVKHIKRVGIIKKPTEIKLLLDQKFAMLPFNTTLNDIDRFDSDYCFFNYDYLNSPKKDIFISKMKFFKKCYNGFYDKNSITNNIKNLAAPYNVDSDEKKGFIVLETHTDTDKFILNKTSLNFKNISINTEEDLNLSPDLINNNYLTLNINKKLYTDNKIKIDLLLSENNVIGYTYIDDEILKDKEEIILNDSTLSNINEMVIDYINKSEFDNKEQILKEFKNIIELNKK